MLSYFFWLMIMKLIKNGNIDSAFRKLREWYPQVVQVCCWYLWISYGFKIFASSIIFLFSSLLFFFLVGLHMKKLAVFTNYLDQGSKISFCTAQYERHNCSDKYWDANSSCIASLHHRIKYYLMFQSLLIDLKNQYSCKIFCNLLLYFSHYYNNLLLIWSCINYCYYY